MWQSPGVNPSVIVVMGVAGSGKSTIASRLAARLHWRFAEGDSFHPPANVARMREGIPLTDEDRAPWLDAIAAWIDATRAAGERCVVTCSALKRAYRERLVDGHADVRFVYLKGEYGLVARRMAQRTGHYMPVALLQSQFDALEEPLTAESPLIVAIERPPDEIVATIVAGFEVKT
jgi:gluconokinase